MSDQPRLDLKVYLDKMMKVTPVYIIALLAALEPALAYFSDKTINEQYMGLALVFFFGIVALLVFEGYGRRLGLKKKLQLGLVVITSCLYLLVGGFRAMGVNIMTLEYGYFLLLFMAGWTYLAPLILVKLDSDVDNSDSSSDSG
jgi:hypothetical protein